MSERARLTLKQGGLYLSREIRDRYFRSLDSIILLRKDRDLLILPVRDAASGGYLLKQRNAAGDRVVNAPDFFRAHGFVDETVYDLKAVWSAENAGLVVSDIF